jgi:hypothetical protein
MKMDARSAKTIQEAKDVLKIVCVAYRARLQPPDVIRYDDGRVVSTKNVVVKDGRLEVAVPLSLDKE